MNEITDLAKSLAAIRGELSVRVSKMTDLIRSIEYFIEDPNKLEAPYVVAALPVKDQAKKDEAPSSENSTVENVRRILLKADVRGLPTRELLIFLEELKCPVKGKRPIQTLYGILYKDSKSKHPRVRRNDMGNWEPSEWKDKWK